MGRYLAAFIVCGLAMGNGVMATASAAEEAAPVPGRYQIVFSPLVRADTFMIDTATGTVWQSANVGTSNAWVLMQRIYRVLSNAAAPSPKPPASPLVLPRGRE